MSELELIPVKEEHLEMIRNWRMRENVTKYMYTDPKITPEQQRMWYETAIKDITKRMWLIICDSNPIGIYQLEKIDHVNKNTFWGYYIAKDEYQGKGIGRDIECNMYDYIFDVMGLHKACVEVFDWNHPVISLHSRHGCNFEGTFSEQILKNGIYHNVTRLGLLSDDWHNFRECIDYHKVEVFNFEEPVVFGTCNGLEEVTDDYGDIMDIFEKQRVKG